MSQPFEIDFVNHPRKSKEQLDKLYPGDALFVISEIMKTKADYLTVFQDLIDILKYGYEIEEVRHRPVFYKFKKTDKKVREMRLNNFISSLIYWSPLIDVDKVGILDDSWIVNFDNFNSTELQNFINNKLLPAYENADFEMKNVMIDDIYHYIISISKAFCLLQGLSLSMYNLHQAELRNPELMHVIRDPVDTNKEPYEIEQELNERNNRMIQLFMEDPFDNDYKPFFKSKAGLKNAQFREYLIMIGFKSDINGNTVPILINDSFLMNGLTKPSHVYLNALAGRKALILTKLIMMAA